MTQPSSPHAHLLPPLSTYHVEWKPRGFFVVQAESHNHAKAVVYHELKLTDFGTWDEVKVQLHATAEKPHETVGQRFRGPQNEPGVTPIYLCNSYDSRQGFWMQNEADPADRRNVSERAINRTFHRIYPPEQPCAPSKD